MDAKYRPKSRSDATFGEKSEPRRPNKCKSTPDQLLKSISQPQRTGSLSSNVDRGDLRKKIDVKRSGSNHRDSSSVTNDSEKISARKVKGYRSVPNFDGTDVDGWLFTVEQYFEHNHIPDSDKVHLCYFLVHGPALNWYYLMKRNGLLGSWSKFIEDVRFRFGSSTYRAMMSILFQVSQTGGVRQYIEEFEVALMRIDGISEQKLVIIFISGLKFEIRSKLWLDKPVSLKLAMELALFYGEQDLKPVKDSLLNHQSNNSFPVASSVSNEHLELVCTLANDCDQPQEAYVGHVDETGESESNGSQVNVLGIRSAGEELKDCSAKLNEENKIVETKIKYPIQKLSTEETRARQDKDNENGDDMFEKGWKIGLVFLNLDFATAAMFMKKWAGKAVEMNGCKGSFPTFVIDSFTAVIDYDKTNLLGLNFVFDPGGVLEFSNENFEVEAFNNDRFSGEKDFDTGLIVLWGSEFTRHEGIDLYRDNFTYQRFWESFESLANPLFKNSFTATGVDNFLGGMLHLSHLLVDYKELLSWVYDLEGKVNLKGWALL